MPVGEKSQNSCGPDHTTRGSEGQQGAVDIWVHCTRTATAQSHWNQVEKFDTERNQKTSMWVILSQMIVLERMSNWSNAQLTMHLPVTLQSRCREHCPGIPGMQSEVLMKEPLQNISNMQVWSE